jgi:hypothetical protein
MGETMCGVSAGAEGLALVHSGFVVVEGTHEGVDSAWAAARDVIDAAASLDDLCARIGSRLQRVGEFVVPAPGAPQRDFQGLHLDFGVPSGRAQPLPLARYTALFVDPTVVASGAQTRLVPLDLLAPQRDWPGLGLLHGRVARRMSEDHSEGIFGRLIEAVDDTSDLPAKDAEGFLCGLEYASLGEEESFFAAHGLDLSGVETRVTVEPGGLMVFDNLRCAHGRVGRRRVGELHQLCVGYADLPAAGQRLALDAFLTALTAGASVTEPVSRCANG